MTAVAAANMTTVVMAMANMTAMANTTAIPDVPVMPAVTDIPVMPATSDVPVPAVTDIPVMPATSDVPVPAASVRASFAVPAGPRNHAMVPLKFRDPLLIKNKGFVVLWGPIVEKADFMRDFLTEALPNMVYEQKIPYHVQLLSKITTDGLSLQERALILQGLEVSMANVDTFQRAFVVRLPQLKHTLWRIWPDTPKDPHITLAFIGDYMHTITDVQRNLILLALRELAGIVINKKDSIRKRRGFARMVRDFLRTDEPTDNQITLTFAQIKHPDDRPGTDLRRL